MLKPLVIKLIAEVKVEQNIAWLNIIEVNTSVSFQDTLKAKWSDTTRDFRTNSSAFKISFFNH